MSNEEFIEQVCIMNMNSVTGCYPKKIAQIAITNDS